MEDKGLKRIGTLEKLNSDPNWVNTDLYRLMYREDLYITAYERLKSAPGNMTAGHDGSTLDGFSLRTIKSIAKAMQDESFQFSPSRRVYIPKANGGKRPLGIAPPRDKVVQEVLRMILEAIYDSQGNPTFLPCSHGFRNGRGTHTALRDIRGWHNTRWYIEGDIKGCFDNVDHHVLVGILRERIKDERFLGLIWKAIRAGYVGSKGGRLEMTLTGTPQGSILSPILANIYLHKLDSFVASLIKTYDTSGTTKRKPNPDYRRVAHKIERRKKVREPDWKEIQKLGNELRQTPFNDPNDPDYIRIRYIRYADDWIAGIEGPHSLAESLRDKIGAFLKEELALTLSPEKTFIRHAETEQAIFLGTVISKGKQSSPRISTVEDKRGRSYTKRTTGWTMRMHAPIPKLVSKLSQVGFCDGNGHPTHRKDWVNLDPFDILESYNAVLQGILNFYSFVDNRNDLRRIEYILHHSCTKTLANKLKLGTRRKVFAKFGRDLTFKEDRGGTEVSRSFTLAKNFKAQPMRFLTSEEPTDRLRTYNSKLTRSSLGHACAVCGTTDGIEMHHVRHIRKRGAKLTGFHLQMAMINRKQVPLCLEHHLMVHNGKLDNFSLR